MHTPLPVKTMQKLFQDKCEWNGYRMMTSIVTGDLEAATADLLQAQDRKLAESQTKFQAEFEAGEAKFNAELEAMSSPKRQDLEKPKFVDKWLLARKCWAWLYHDD